MQAVQRIADKEKRRCSLKDATTCLQIIAAIRKRRGFMKLDPKGVDAAKSISPAISPTTRQIASGPFVIKPVMVPIPFLSLSVSMINSMETLMRSISKIMPLAPIKDSCKFPSNKRALPQKKSMTRIHTRRSRRRMESIKKSFINSNAQCFKVIGVG